MKTLRCKARFYWFLIPLLLPALFDMVQIGINLLSGGRLPGFTFIRTQWHLIPIFMLHNLHPLGGPIGEEIFGYRGYALPRLQSKYGPLIASVIIGGILFHLMFNTTDSLLLTSFTMGTINKFPAIDRRLLYLHCIVTLLAALVVSIKTKGLLGRKMDIVPQREQVVAGGSL